MLETLFMGTTFREESFPLRQEKDFPDDMLIFFCIYL